MVSLLPPRPHAPDPRFQKQPQFPISGASFWEYLVYTSLIKIVYLSICPPSHLILRKGVMDTCTTGPQISRGPSVPRPGQLSFRVTNCPSLPGTEGFLGCGVSSFKTGRILGKPKRVGQPTLSLRVSVILAMKDACFAYNLPFNNCFVWSSRVILFQGRRSGAGQVESIERQCVVSTVRSGRGCLGRPHSV